MPRPDVLWCSKNKGWSFPVAVEKRLIKDTEGKSVLHLFGGRSRFGVRLDIDPFTAPHVLGDAWLPPFGKQTFDVVVLDPPYFHMNGRIKYALFAAAGYIARETVIWFSTIWQANTAGLRLEKSSLVRVGDSCAVRCLQYFAVVNRPGPVNHFSRGPCMKYNRWLAQPNSLNLHAGEDFQ